MDRLGRNRDHLKIMPGALVVVGDTAAEAAETAMWLFYREWSCVAQTVVKERELRRILGFLQSKPHDSDVPVATPVTGP